MDNAEEYKKKSKEDIDKLKKDLTTYDIESILKLLGVKDIKEISENGAEVLITETVCHHGSKHKLYYYVATKTFHCYTDCGDSFDIIELVRRSKNLDSQRQAYKWITNQLGIDNYAYGFDNQPTSNARYLSNDFEFIDRFVDINKLNKIPKVDIIPKSELAVFQDLYYKGWIEEGISIASMKKYDIKFSSLLSRIIIPHYNIDNDLIGIRTRALIEEEIEEFGKYTPLMWYGKMYNHSLSLNLYGINQNKEAIKKHRKVMLVESEKGTLQADTMFGDDNYTLGLCGNNLTEYQVQMLLDLGVEEVIIGLDRQYKEVGDDEYYRWSEHIRKRLVSKLAPYFRVYILWDTKGYLQYKDSPTDRGKDILLKLMDDKIYVGTFDEKYIANEHEKERMKK